MNRKCKIGEYDVFVAVAKARVVALKAFFTCLVACAVGYGVFTAVKVRQTSVGELYTTIAGFRTEVADTHTAVMVFRTSVTGIHTAMEIIYTAVSEDHTAMASPHTSVAEIHTAMGIFDTAAAMICTTVSDSHTVVFVKEVKENGPETRIIYI